MGQRKQKTNINKLFALIELLNKDKRYNPEAYAFIIASLDYTTKKLKRKGHVSGEELLEGVREHSMNRFGPMARLVLEYWGIKKTNDIGEIVFNMIDSGILGKTDNDSKKDFDDKFDFKTAFDESFRFSLPK